MGPPCKGIDDSAPMGGWLGFYFRGGPAIPLGNDPFTSHRDAGASIQFGVRQRLSKNPYDYMFFDLGGSFMSLQGQRSAVTPGDLKNSVTNVFTPVNNFFNSTLLNVRRSALDIAVGSYFNPLAYFGVAPGRVRAILRGGGRFGSYYGRFHDTPTPDLLAAIANARALGETFTISSNYNKTSSFAGLFAAAGFDVILWEPGPRCSARRYVSVGGDVEYSHDWIGFTRFANLNVDALSIMAFGTFVF